MLVAARFNEISQYCFSCLVSNVNLKLFRGVNEGFLEKVDLRTPPYYNIGFVMSKILSEHYNT